MDFVGAGFLRLVEMTRALRLPQKKRAVWPVFLTRLFCRQLVNAVGNKPLLRN